MITPTDLIAKNDLNDRKECFSYAYVQAVASVAGFSVCQKNRMMDNSGIDITMESPRSEEGQFSFPKFDAQVKCTSSTNMIKDKKGFYEYKLRMKNYNDLIAQKTIIPRLLILVLVPSEIEEWVNICEEKTLMKKCGYWISLQGYPSVENKSSKSRIPIEIPKANLFTPSSLTEIMKKISKGEKL